MILKEKLGIFANFKEANPARCKAFRTKKHITLDEIGSSISHWFILKSEYSSSKGDVGWILVEALF